MKIQIDGINTSNKGAELMLVAILEQLETRYPGATIFLNPDSKLDEQILPNYNLRIRRRLGLKLGRYVNGVAYKLKLKQPINYFNENYAPKNTDIILDASGFKFSDQWNRSKSWLDIKESYYKKAKNNGTKIYFLTQALGPFRTENGKRSIEIISRYADLIFAREEMSYSFAIEGGAKRDNLRVSCDFTLKVEGSIPSKFKKLSDGICIIPNKKMITHGGNNSNSYLDLFLNVIRYFHEKGDSVFLLNHEASGDFNLCQLINSHFDNKLDIVSGLSAKDVKGVIGISKMVISSRFHGVASALSQGVPCIATSWNHKYEMLFKLFGQSNCIINANRDIKENIATIDDLYSSTYNTSAELKFRKSDLIKQIDEMWDIIFNHYEQSNQF